MRNEIKNIDVNVAGLWIGAPAISHTYDGIKKIVADIVETARGVVRVRLNERIIKR